MGVIWNKLFPDDGSLHRPSPATLWNLPEVFWIFFAELRNKEAEIRNKEKESPQGYPNRSQDALALFQAFLALAEFWERRPGMSDVTPAEVLTEISSWGQVPSAELDPYRILRQHVSENELSRSRFWVSELLNALFERPSRIVADIVCDNTISRNEIERIVYSRPDVDYSSVATKYLFGGDPRQALRESPETEDNYWKLRDAVDDADEASG